MSARHPASKHSPRVGFVSLGCPKALVDSERILTQLRVEGYAIAPHYQDADLVVVNTCGFIDEARAESLEAIGEALRENGRVIVTGCLGTKEGDVRSVHPSVLEITGAHAYEAVMTAVHRHLPAPEPGSFTALVPPQGIRLTPRHYAYLKISEGCNHHCRFCIIPSLRGGLASRDAADVLSEAARLVEAGVQELIVISQDTSAFGSDIRYRPAIWDGRIVKSRLTDLCKALGEFGVWVRLQYVYPYPHVDELIPLMAEGRLLPYLDIPFQHASPRILRLMRRPASGTGTLERIHRWRAIRPDLALRSSFIVGFPGETEDDFRILLDFLEAAQIDRVGCFRYSPVEGAQANTLPDPVPEEVKHEREARLMEVQRRISAARLKARVGRDIEVLIDARDGHAALARSAGEAPEIDGIVRIRHAGALQPGDRVRVRVTKASDHDLEARISAP